MKSGALQITANNTTKSSQITAFLRETFEWDRSKKLKRIYWELPAAHVYLGKTPIDSFDIGDCGIKSYYSAFMNGTMIKYRECSCFCETCIKRLFSGHCRQRVFSGSYHKLNDIPEHKAFKVLRREYTQNLIDCSVI
eukprot:894837_1